MPVLGPKRLRLFSCLRTAVAVSSSMRQSGKESVARWLFLVATSITWLQLMKTDDNITGRYEGITLEVYRIIVTLFSQFISSFVITLFIIEKDIDWLNETQLLQLYEYEYEYENENETFENFTDSSEDLRELLHNFIIENNGTDIGNNINSTDNNSTTSNNSTITISNSNSNRSTDNNSSNSEEKVLFEETRKSHHMSRVLIMALFLHIALIGAGKIS